ncbi:MAG: DUF2460 domain-containing protein [Planctomycetes bacterium]|nr:DUF2460 domain-containing protein [Planctomycetota bacterium]
MSKMCGLRPITLGAVGFLVITVAGCGKPVPIVRGTVAVDGVPLSSGSVTFESVDGSTPSVGTTITDGSFDVPVSSQITPGKKKVTIRGSMKTGKQVQAAPPAPKGVMVDDLIFYPPPGGKPEVREADINEGENDLRFDLTAKSFEKPK